MPTALVTGASGFVGSHLCDALLRRDYTVRALVRKTSDLRWLRDDRIQLCYGEVTAGRSLAEAVRGVEVVFHSAGALRSGDEATYRKVNVDGTRNVVRAAIENASSLRRFLLVSSLAAGGPSAYDRPRIETDPDRPNNAYGRSKRSGEDELRQAASGLPWTIVRPPAVYGPRDTGFLILAKMASRGWVTRVAGTPQPASVVEIDDLVRGTIDAAESPEAVGKTYYLAHAEPTELATMGVEMGRALGIRVRTVTVPRWAVPVVGWGSGLLSALTGRPNALASDRIRDLLAPAWTCDATLAAKDFGFEANVGLDTGIPRVMAWYRETGWI